MLPEENPNGASGTGMNPECADLPWGKPHGVFGEATAAVHMGRDPDM